MAQIPPRLAGLDRTRGGQLAVIAAGFRLALSEPRRSTDNLAVERRTLAEQ